MNREEILQKARKENAGVDEVTNEATKYAARISQSVGALVCALFNFLDAVYFHTDVISSVCWIIYGSMIASGLWVYFAELKKRWYLVGALFTTLAVILLAVMLFMEFSHA